MTSIGWCAFSGCNDLTSVNISDLSSWFNIVFGDQTANPTYYAHKLVLDGAEIKDLVIPDGVTAVKSSAFYGCHGLTSVTIPNSVTSIGEWAFYECSGLTSVIIGSSVTSIGYDAFSGCSGLTSVSVLAAAPPAFGSDFLSSVGTSTIHVYEGLAEAYRAASGWSSFTIVDDIPLPGSVTISVSADAEMGSVTGAGKYTEGNMVTLTAVAAEGYEFVSWSDGTTENPYVFIANEDKTLTATFRKKRAVFSISATCNSRLGSVTGAGEYSEGDQVTLTATPASGYKFASWSDGTTENPYVFTASKDMILTARFNTILPPYYIVSP